MKINITTKNITLDEPIRVFIEEKIGGLDKFIQKGPISAMVEIGKPSRHHKSGPIFYGEVNLKIGGYLLRGEGGNKDLRTAISEARDELYVQIKKLKGKRKDLSRQPSK